MKTNKFLLLCVVLLCTLSLSGQNKPIIVDLWPNGAPNSNGVKGEETFVAPGIPTNISKPNMTIYPSSKPNSKAIIMCPGGGYTAECATYEGNDMASWMNSIGVTFIVIKYRLPNNGHYEVPASDTHRAIVLAREHCKEWNIDPHAVGIMGASAGGHLAATTANLYTKENRPDFQILLYPVITMKTGKTHQGSRETLLGKNPSAELVNKYSLELQVTEKTPRAFITLASDDSLVPPCNSLDYCSALIAHHVPVALFVYPTGEHGFGFHDSFVFKRQWTGELEKWLSTF